MREIKFRGQRLDNGEWIYGCYAEFVNYLDGATKPGIQVTKQVPSAMDRMLPAWETELIEVDPETVGQFIGRHDKNGKDIYEDDIVSLCTYSHDEPINVFEGQLILGIYGIGIIGTDEIGTSDCFWFRDVEGFINHWEVIGNIHENPELLK